MRPDAMRPRLSAPLLASLLVLAACDGEGTGPVGTGAIAFLDVTPLVGRVASVGDSIQYSAVAVFDDGRREPVEASWFSGDSSVLTFGSDGWAVARSLGATTVEARAENATGPGTFVVNADIVPPRLVDAFVQPNRVNVFQRAGSVRLVADFEDRSGTKAALAVFAGPLGAGITGLVTMTEVVDSTQVADPTRTRFEGLLEIPGNVGVGTWRLSALRADDRAGNTAQWGEEALINQGFDLVVVAVLTGGNP